MSYGQQGGPQSQWDPWKPQSQQPWNSGGGHSPDWEALAEAAEAAQATPGGLLIGGCALATLAIGTVVALASSRRAAKHGATPRPPCPPLRPPEPDRRPRRSPRPRPAPAGPARLHRQRQQGHGPVRARHPLHGERAWARPAYEKGPTAGTRNCARRTGATSAQGPHRERLHRPDTRDLHHGQDRGDGRRRPFDTEDQAAGPRGAASDGFYMSAPLSGGDAPPFCEAGFCRTTSHHLGRYAYFTIAGTATAIPDARATPRPTRPATTGRSHGQPDPPARRSAGLGSGRRPTVSSLTPRQRPQLRASGLRAARAWSAG